MAKPRALILRAPGTNCDQETAFAFERAAACVELLHINRLIEQPAIVDRFQILCIPGGFSYGDDIAAGRILGNQIRHHLYEALLGFQAADKLVLGICNGFQVLTKAGILLADADREPTATLTWNDCGRFEDRWVHLTADASRCVFLRDIEALYLPVAHAEGKFVTHDREICLRLADSGQLALRYADPHGDSPSRLDYPLNPNGSEANVAGVCDETGRVFGLMPHPERHIERTHHPRWTRGEGQEPGDGLRLFQNAVRYFQ